MRNEGSGSGLTGRRQALSHYQSADQLQTGRAERSSLLPELW